MKKNFYWKQLILTATVLGASVCVDAQEAPFNVNLKLRTGFQAGSLKDNLSNRLMGFGLDGGMNTSVGRFGFELGWSYKPGNHYLADLSKMSVASGRAIIPGKAVDSRKTSMEGLAARISYEKGLVGDLGIIAGLQVGGTKFTQEYIADVQGGAAPTTSASATTFRDTYNGTPIKNTVSVSPFIGVTYRFNSFSSVEVNLVALRYTAIDYVHQAGFASTTATTTPNRDISQDSLVENKSVAPHIEVGYVFRF